MMSTNKLVVKLILYGSMFCNRHHIIMNRERQIADKKNIMLRDSCWKELKFFISDLRYIKGKEVIAQNGKFWLWVSFYFKTNCDSLITNLSLSLINSKVGSLSKILKTERRQKCYLTWGWYKHKSTFIF